MYINAYAHICMYMYTDGSRFLVRIQLHLHCLLMGELCVGFGPKDPFRGHAHEMHCVITVNA